MEQDLYPYAAGGPASYMRPGQRFWGTQSTVGGWYRGTSALKTMLIKAGLPQTAPASDRVRIGGLRGIGIAAAAGVVLAGAGFAVLRRRRR